MTDAPRSIPSSVRRPPDPAALYRALVESHPEPTFSLDVDGTLLGCNRAFARFVGIPAPSLLGRPLVDLLLDAERPLAERALTRVRGGVGHTWKAEFVGPDDTISIGLLTLAPVAIDGHLVGVQGIARDVTVYQVMEEQLHARVFTDPLTGLASRTQLHEAVDRAARRAPLPAQVAVLVVDLDDFKLVNDGLGHATGDRLLGVVADRLRRATRGGDLVARLGGDDFAILLDALGSPEDAAIVVGRITAALAEPIDLDGRPVIVTASIGVAIWDGLSSPAELVRQADLAMYRAKAFGKARHAVFDATMQVAARERLELAGDLRDAIAAGAITSVYQPIVELVSGRVVKAEALARWTHPTRGPISPAVFIPIAEEMHLVDDLGALMLGRACAELRRWQDAARARGVAPVGVTVNVSGRQVERGTVLSAVRGALAASGADPAGLTLELTESVAMRDPERMLALLDDLAALGVRVAIDDFGTGYSSLAYLHRFRVHTLKIDRAFVIDLDADTPDASAAALTRTMLAVSASLGLETVAEGIETEAQRGALVALGCPLGQGWLFGRPGPGEAIVPR